MRLMYIIVSTLYFLYYSFAQLFVSRGKRQEMWRRAVRGHNRLLLKIAGIKLHLHDVPDTLKHSSLIISNHPAMTDGFMYFSLFGPDVIPVTGPARYFHFPFGRVFKNMGAIDIARTDEEEERFPDSYSREASMVAMKEALEENKHVLIFPEGHIEQTQQLYYVHSGAARVSISTGRPLAVFSSTGAEHVFIDKTRIRPGTMHVHFHGYIHPKQQPKPSHAAVKKLQKEIEDTFVRVLPHQYIPDYISYTKPKNIAAFVDIDNTLYNGIFTKDLVIYLMRQRSIPRHRGMYLLWLLLMETLRLMPHKMIMRKAHRVLRGLSEKEVVKMSSHFFDTHGKHNLHDDMENLIKNHVEKGHRIVIVTEMIEPLARLFGKHIGADGVFGTRMHAHKKTYSGDIDRLNYAENKAACLHRFAKDHDVNLKKSYAYGDSFSCDHHMLACVGNPVAMYPDRKLRGHARKRKWKIVQ